MSAAQLRFAILATLAAPILAAVYAGTLLRAMLDAAVDVSAEAARDLTIRWKRLR